VNQAKRAAAVHAGGKSTTTVHGVGAKVATSAERGGKNCRDCVAYTVTKSTPSLY
jgi:hypothetical protein